MNRTSKTTQLVTIALLLTMEIILTRLCSLYMPTGFRIGLGFLPIAIVGILYGPLWGGVTYALGDLIGALLFPAGAYFPGFTLTAFLTGAAFGLFLHGREITWKRVLLPSILSLAVCSLVLDTYWLYLLYDQAIAAILPMRVVKCFVSLALEITLIPLVWNRCISKIPSLRPVAGK